MFEIFALVIYSVQWLGVVLGVGAEVVLLCAHLIALHQHKPQWLASIPAVRAAQFIGLVLIILSGFGAVLYQFLIGQPGLLLEAVFAFKWALIVGLAAAYVLEKRVARGRAVFEGFAGATWLALFLVHSLAPIASWIDLAAYYVAWVGVFSLGWGAAVLAMRRTKSAVVVTTAVEPAPLVKTAPIVARVVPKPAPAPVIVAAPAPVVKPIVHVAPPPPPKPISKPVFVPAPKPIAVAAPAVATITLEVKKESLWHKLMSLFAKKQKPAAPEPIIVADEPKAKVQPVKPVVHVAPPVIKIVTPVPHPSPVVPKPVVVPVAAAVTVASHPENLPVIEHLELVAPHVVVAPKPAVVQHYTPDYNHIPGLRVMPQRAEDVHLQNRAPLVQLA